MTSRRSTIKKPKLTVVVPVYNVEHYLRQAIDSIVNQSIGFESNIELILVDDGSTDKSGDICKEYADIYPGNIRYVRQKNQGVSAARNKGLELATGKYITFFDSDDIWSKHALRDSVRFLEGAGDAVDVVATKIKFFDHIIDEHPSNYKFKKTRIIDLEKEPDNPLLHLPTCVIRTSVAKDFIFDTKLKVTEDAKFLSEVLVRKKAYGVLAKGVYHYRKRGDTSSAIASHSKSKYYCLVVPKLAYESMMDTWRDNDGAVGKFMQYEILSELYWRVQQQPSSLSDSEASEYRGTIKRIIDQIDDDVILSKRGLDAGLKYYFLRMKYAESAAEHIGLKDGVYLCGDKELLNVKSSVGLHIEFIKSAGENRYKIEGYIEGDGISPTHKYFIETSQGKYRLEPTKRKQRLRTFLGDVIDGGGTFEVFIDMAPQVSTDTIRAGLGYDEQPVYVRINAEQFSGFSKLKNSYRVDGRRLLRKKAYQIDVASYSYTKHFVSELTYLLSIITNLRLNDAIRKYKQIRTRNLEMLPLRKRLFEIGKPILIVGEAIVMIPRSLLLRFLYYIFKLSYHRPLWLISDRGMAAGDNGEALYRHILSRDDVYVDVRFVISKKSKDYARLSALAGAKLLNQDSFKYKLLFLLADKIISSQADVEVTNPFIRQYDHFADLMTFDFVFLQHGIIRHDLSSWLNRFNKNISLFVTSADVEYSSILELPYYYSDKEVALTGLPRFDLLDSKPQNKIVFAPTYRKALVAKIPTNKNGARAYSSEFKESAYFDFYNKLINDERLLGVMKKQKMTGEFYLHPALAAQTVDFESNNIFGVKDFPYDYKTAFTEGSLLVSDYSSVVFDFAYLKKPIIYAQYDVDEFFKAQLYEKTEFFTDANDGFGPITYTYDATVDEIIKSINNNCEMDQKYVDRVDKFFYKSDKKNSERVYNAIIELDREAER